MHATTSDTWTAPELIKVASRSGRKIDSPTLRLWTRRGLLHEPAVVGLGRGRGTEARYPQAAEARVRRVCKWLNYYDRYPAVAWCLWTDPEEWQFGSEDFRPFAEPFLKLQLPIWAWMEIDAAEGHGLTRSPMFKGLRSAIRKARGRRRANGADSDAAWVLLRIVADPEILIHSSGLLHSIGKKASTESPTNEAPTWATDDLSLREMVHAAEFLRDLLDPFVPGWDALGPDPPATERVHPELKPLRGFQHVLLQNRGMLVPTWFLQWLGDSDRVDVEEVIADVVHVQGNLFPGRSDEPPSFALLYIAVLVRNMAVSFRGLRDVFQWQGSPEPYQMLCRFLDALPVKKTLKRDTS